MITNFIKKKIASNFTKLVKQKYDIYEKSAGHYLVLEQAFSSFMKKVNKLLKIPSTFKLMKLRGD